jgi:hypothetical protein
VRPRTAPAGYAPRGTPRGVRPAGSAPRRRGTPRGVRPAGYAPRRAGGVRPAGYAPRGTPCGVRPAGYAPWGTPRGVCGAYPAPRRGRIRPPHNPRIHPVGYAPGVRGAYLAPRRGHIRVPHRVYLALVIIRFSSVFRKIKFSLKYNISLHVICDDGPHCRMNYYWKLDLPAKDIDRSILTLQEIKLRKTVGFRRTQTQGMKSRCATVAPILYIN